MESQTACRPEKLAQTAPNLGLESLAAEASRRAELMETQAEPGPSGEGEGTARTSQASGQKSKVRKAYTITKQRERWTDGEHERFLQALKRYGRAWRKIEEHIGTKTAVQIRSHAQKFFSKLQREQSANRGPGEESSKAGISIPPPRPKRKPMHPYPRKLSENGTDNTASCQQPALVPQPSALPSQAQLLSYPMLDTRGGEPSLGQVLEAAAMAAANAWSQVVASAGSKVQQQLQAHVAAQQGAQGVSPFMSMSSMNSVASGLAGMNPALLYQMAAQQPPQQMAANLQSSSHHPMGTGAFLNMGNPDGSLTGTSTPHRQGQTQSMQDSPDGGGNVADQGNDRDSACSKEYSRGKTGPGLDQAAATLAGRQSGYEGWQSQDTAPQSESRLGRVAWELMAQANAATAATANAPVGGSQWTADHALLAALNRNPSRAFSAGAVLHGRQAAQQVEQDPGQSSQGAVEAEATGHRGKRLAAQSKSDTSQLANFYQQAAAEEQQAADEQQAAENGSTGDGGSSGDCSNGKLGLPRSDKGSNAGTSGSDEDGNVNGSGSGSDNGAIDPTDATDVNATDGKGSDEGSNSPRAPFTRNSTPSGEPSKPQTAAVGGPKRTPQQGMFSLGSGIDHARMAAATSQLQHQQPSTLTHPLAQQPHAQAGAVVVPQAMLSQQALAAYQQQALSAWAAGAQQPHAMSYQLIQSLLSNLQNHSRDKMPVGAFVAPPAGEGSLMDRKSSGVASMDTFRANSSRSYSVPPGIATGTEGPGSRDGLQAMGEEASGFKPYNKRHGMPVTSLPPTKRFVAATSAGNKPVAAVAAAPNVITAAAAHCPATAGMQPGLYSPFGLVGQRDPSRKA